MVQVSASQALYYWLLLLAEFFSRVKHTQEVLFLILTL